MYTCGGGRCRALGSESWYISPSKVRHHAGGLYCGECWCTDWIVASVPSLWRVVWPHLPGNVLLPSSLLTLLLLGNCRCCSQTRPSLVGTSLPVQQWCYLCNVLNYHNGWNLWVNFTIFFPLFFAVWLSTGSLVSSVSFLTTDQPVIKDARVSHWVCSQFLRQDQSDPPHHLYLAGHTWWLLKNLTTNKHSFLHYKLLQIWKK